MPITIRQANKQDAQSIAEIIQLAFEEDASIEQIRLCMEQEAHWTYVAENADTIVGFVFGFMTISIDGEKRRELDLQAVHPDYQGQGIGKKLIHHFTTDGIAADGIRALVAVDNIRMEKALSQFGYKPENQEKGLYVASHAADKASVPNDSHLIPVISMTYNGIWLEGKITTLAINAALSLRQNENDIVGAVVPISDESATAALKLANFHFIKQYRHWIRR